MEPFKPVDIEGHRVLPFPVNHTVGAVGFEIISKDEKKVFYSSDTGPGLSTLWEHMPPQLVIIDVTFPNKLGDTAKNQHTSVPGC